MKRPLGAKNTPYWVRMRVWLFVWWLSRYRSPLLFGLPSFFLGLVVFVAIGVFALSAQERQDAYRQAATVALAGKDYAAARCYFQRLTIDDPQNLEFQYGLAVSLNKLGQTEAGAILMDRLAPLTGKGHAPAHLALASELLAKPKLEADDKRALEQHLLRVRTMEPNNVQARVMLGEHYMRTDRPQLAEKQFLAVVQTQEQLCLPLARLYQRAQNPSEAQRWAERAAAYYHKKAESNHDDSNAHIRWAEAVLMKGDCAPALSILQEAWDVTNDPAYHDPIAQTSQVALDILSRSKEPRFLDKIAVLKTGLEHGWANPALIEQLRQLSFPKKEEETKLSEAVEQLIRVRPEWGLLHFLKASECLRNRKADEARTLIAKAFKLQADLDKAINNLAHQLSEGNKTDKPDLPRALELMNYVVLISPQDAQHRKTRGQIYLKMGLLPEAQRDLEMALAAMADNADLHERLAEVYGLMGMQRMSLEFKETADRLKAKVSIAGK